MKGVVIFDDRSDLAFFSVDKEMKKFILNRISTLDAEAGSNVSQQYTPCSECILYSSKDNEWLMFLC